ncbi:MAG: PEP-CTERM sorting domain-containing protein [Phycisphaerae bacterium]|nr:PEP-CTERM sorting domain-containing protein [Phycisphaerae bacterium]
MSTTSNRDRRASQHSTWPVRRPFRGLALGVFLATAAVVNATPLTGGNLLINTDRILLEFTPSGDWVQTIPIPYPGPAAERARDIVVDRQGHVLVYNGTTAPYLSCYDAAADAWSHTTFARWSNLQNDAYGGIAAHEQYAFVTDMVTFSGAAKGVVRFDRDQSTALRFATDIEPIDLNLGLDGLLYVLYPSSIPNGRCLDVYDPITLDRIRRLDLTASLGSTAHRSVAANAAGEIFLADPDGELHRLSATGALLATTTLTAGTQPADLYDVDVMPDGTMVLGDRYGHVFVTNKDFSDSSAFSVGVNSVFVTYVPHVPEPSAALLLLLGSVALLARRSASGRGDSRLPIVV